jgi:hypothetical protein
MSTCRNRLITCGFALGLIAIGATLGAGTAVAAPAPRIHVHGSLVRAASSSEDVPFTFSVNATAPAPPSGINGTFSGSFPHDPYPTPDRFSAPGNWATFSGRVYCLQLNGDTATIGGVITSGYGYDSVASGDGYSTDQRDLAGDWFIVLVQDPQGKSPDLMSYVDFGTGSYFSAAWGFSTFTSMCDNAAVDDGAPQFPLASGDITIDS